LSLKTKSKPPEVACAASELVNGRILFS